MLLSPMQTLRRVRWLVRLVLAGFVMSIGVVVASPMLHPQALELICSGAGVIELRSHTDGGAVPQSGPPPPRLPRGGARARPPPPAAPPPPPPPPPPRQRACAPALPRISLRALPRHCRRAGPRPASDQLYFDSCWRKRITRQYFVGPAHSRPRWHSTE